MNKFGEVWDTTNWEDGQQECFMYNSRYITLCSSNKREQVIIRDATAKEAAKEILTLRLNLSFTLIHFQRPHSKRNTVFNRIHSLKRSMRMVHEKIRQETPETSTE